MLLRIEKNVKIFICLGIANLFLRNLAAPHIRLRIFFYLCNQAGGGRLTKGLEYAVPYRNPEF